MKTIPEMRRVPYAEQDFTRPEREKLAAYYVRLGRLMDKKTGMPKHEPAALMSRATTVATSWRSVFAWRLYNSLGISRLP